MEKNKKFLDVEKMPLQYQLIWYNAIAIEIWLTCRNIILCCEDVGAQNTEGFEVKVGELGLPTLARRTNHSLSEP